MNYMGCRSLCGERRTGLIPAEAGHYVTTVGKLFTPTVSSGAEGRINQLTPGIAGTFVVTLGKLFACIGSGLLSLSSLVHGGWQVTLCYMACGLP